MKRDHCTLQAEETDGKRFYRYVTADGEFGGEAAYDIITTKTETVPLQM